MGMGRLFAKLIENVGKFERKLEHTFKKIE